VVIDHVPLADPSLIRNPLQRRRRIPITAQTPHRGLQDLPRTPLALPRPLNRHTHPPSLTTTGPNLLNRRARTAATPLEREKAMPATARHTAPDIQRHLDRSQRAESVPDGALLRGTAPDAGPTA